MPSPPSESSGTLYDPPHETAENVSEEKNSVALQLSLPPDRADRLRAVAQQLGLTPSQIAKRAIQLVCNEVVTVQDDARSTDVFIDQYQARLDLLHTVEAPTNGQLESLTHDD